MIEGIANFGIIIGLLPLLLIFLRKPKQDYAYEIKAIKPFLWLLFIGSIYEIVFSTILLVSVGPWIRAYYLFEFVTLYYFFRKLFVNRYRLVLNSFLIVFVISWIVSLFFWGKVHRLKIDGYLSIQESLLVFTFVLIWFKQLFKGTEFVPLWQTPLFYFLTGFLFYFGGTVFVNLLIDDIFKITGLISKYWLVSVLLNIAMRILLCIGVWKATEKRGLSMS